MIKLIDNFDDYNFACFSDDVFFWRIYSDFNVMSVFDTSMFYVVLDAEVVQAVLLKIDGNITLSAKHDAPFEEIFEFLNIIGFSKILCDNSYSKYFIGKKTSGSILKAVGKNENIRKAKELYSDSLKEVYNLISENFLMETPFAEWFVDISHRMRHNSAKLFGIYESDKLISSAFSLFESDKCAVLSSVVTDKAFRKQGYGEDVIKAVLFENQGKNVYVFTENEKLNLFYSKFGFKDYKMWSEIENVL